MPDSDTIGAPLAGRWHLIPAGGPEGTLPSHRVDLVFHTDDGGFRGAVVSRGDGREIPLQSVTLDGPNLRLRMPAPPGQPDADLPYLVMQAVGDRFEGGWDKAGMEHVRLQLVRAPAMR